MVARSGRLYSVVFTLTCFSLRHKHNLPSAPTFITHAIRLVNNLTSTLRRRTTASENQRLMFCKLSLKHISIRQSSYKSSGVHPSADKLPHVWMIIE